MTCSAKKRGTLLGTLIRANSSGPPSFSRTTTARFSDSPEMYGNGCAGSTASGVSTGKICSRNDARIRSRSAGSSSVHRTMRMFSSAIAGAISSAKTRDCRDIKAEVRSAICSSCSVGGRNPGRRTGSPVCRRRFSPATRTM